MTTLCASQLGECVNYFSYLFEGEMAEVNNQPVVGERPDSIEESFD